MPSDAMLRSKTSALYIMMMSLLYSSAMADRHIVSILSLVFKPTTTLYTTINHKGSERPKTRSNRAPALKGVPLAQDQENHPPQPQPSCSNHCHIHYSNQPFHRAQNSHQMLLNPDYQIKPKDLCCQVPPQVPISAPPF